jgi:hypothetical protein
MYILMWDLEGVSPNDYTALTNILESDQLGWTWRQRSLYVHTQPNENTLVDTVTALKGNTAFMTAVAKQDTSVLLIASDLASDIKGLF